MNCPPGEGFSTGLGFRERFLEGGAAQLCGNQPADTGGC